MAFLHHWRYHPAAMGKPEIYAGCRCRPSQRLRTRRRVHWSLAEKWLFGPDTLFEFAEGCWLRTCSAEDLLVLKLFAHRPQDLVDVESVAALRASSLDWDYVSDNLAPLAEAKDEPRIITVFADLRRRYRVL